MGGHVQSEVPEKTAVVELLERYRETLSLWLQWHTEHEQLSERLFQAGHDQQALTDALDEVGRLLESAVQLSRELLQRSGS